MIHNTSVKNCGSWSGWYRHGGGFRDDNDAMMPSWKKHGRFQWRRFPPSNDSTHDSEDWKRWIIIYGKTKAKYYVMENNESYIIIDNVWLVWHARWVRLRAYFMCTMTKFSKWMKTPHGRKSIAQWMTRTYSICTSLSSQSGLRAPRIFVLLK